MSKKTFEVQTDTVYTNSHYILAHTKEEAEKIAIERAYDNHHGESIMGVDIVDSYENDSIDEDSCDNVY